MTKLSVRTSPVAARLNDRGGVAILTAGFVADVTTDSVSAVVALSTAIAIQATGLKDINRATRLVTAPRLLERCFALNGMCSFLTEASRHRVAGFGLRRCPLAELTAALGIRAQKTSPATFVESSMAMLMPTPGFTQPRKHVATVPGSTAEHDLHFDNLGLLSSDHPTCQNEDVRTRSRGPDCLGHGDRTFVVTDHHLHPHLVEVRGSHGPEFWCHRRPQKLHHVGDWPPRVG